MNIEEDVWREPGSEDQGLGAFAHAPWMPPNRNHLEFSIEGRLYYHGRSLAATTMHSPRDRLHSHQHRFPAAQGMRSK